VLEPAGTCCDDGFDVIELEGGPEVEVQAAQE
jgi:hypothetical protein